PPAGPAPTDTTVPDATEPTAAPTEAPHGPATAAGQPRPPAEEIAVLLARGDALFATGDVASARLFYERAAEAGDGQAAVRLGHTFDPVFLHHAQQRGLRGDVDKAWDWYRRARELGVGQSEARLKGPRGN